MYRVGQIRRGEDSLRAASPPALTPSAAAGSPLPVEVRDQAICEKATRAYYRNELGPYPLDGVAVMRFGDRYAVLGDLRAGEWTILELYNLNFEPIGSLAT